MKLVRAIIGGINQVAVTLGLGLIWIWQNTLSPFFGNACRFEPSCSHYAAEALKKHGFLKGCYLTTGRVLRCNPYCKGGEDPVP